MDPKIQFLTEDDDVLKFRISGINVSLANAIRRIVLSDIPNFVFRTSPYAENKATIHINTSRLNNEIIKQRLSCIPINIKDMDFNYNDYKMEVDVKNDTDTIVIITTDDFKIKNISTDKYLSKESTRKIFPADPITGEYIDFVRLRPKISDDIEGEHLKMECLFDIGKSKEDGSFNVVSCCAYKNTHDPIAQNKAWTVVEQQLRAQEEKTDEIEFAKKDWMALEANRYYQPDSFDFVLETIGVFENREIIKTACQIMIDKLDKFSKNLEQEHELIVDIDNTIQNCYEVVLKEDDYTVGKALEFVLHENYYNDMKAITFCGFRKPHPHISASIIRIGFKKKTDKQEVANIMNFIVEDLTLVFRNIETAF